jgi:hypothetical protein
MKIINLIIIFIFLQYLIPLINLQNIVVYPFLVNLCISLIIGLIQFIYNYITSYITKKEITFKENGMNSLFKSFIVLCGIYSFDIIKARNSKLFTSEEYKQYDKYFTSLFITLLLTFIILIKCLITP